MDFATHKRSGKSTPGIALALLLLMLGMGIMAAIVWGGLITPSNVAQSTTNQGGLIATTLPLSISVTDPLDKTTITGPTDLTFYTPSGGFIAYCATTAGYCTTTGTSFTSGQSVVVSMFTEFYVDSWIPMTIPYVPAGAAGITAIPLSLYQLDNQSFVPTFQIGTTPVAAGVTIGCGGAPPCYKYNFTNTAAQSVTLSMNYVFANSGYLNCNPSTGLQYDIINNICQTATLQITDTSNGLSVKGMPRQYSSGTTRYWWAIMPDGVGIHSPLNGGMGTMAQIKTPGAGLEQGISDSNTAGSLTEQTIGNNLFGGVATATFQVQQGSLGSGALENLTVTLFVNANPTYFPVNNNLGPNVVNASTPFTIIFKGS
jgi:hypothetical protein